MPSTPMAATQAEPARGPFVAAGQRGCFIRDANNNPVATIQPRSDTEAISGLFVSAPAMAAELAVLRPRVEALEKALDDTLNLLDRICNQMFQGDIPCDTDEEGVALEVARALLAPKEG